MKPRRQILALTLTCAATATLLAACGGGSPAASGLLLGTRAQAAGTGGVAVSPMPGTPDASPSTQISFLAGPGTSVADVRVVGSHTGVHSGVLRAYSTGTGESFLPSRPFAQGESVSVSAQVSSGGRTSSARTSFTVAHQASVSETEFPTSPGDPNAVQHYLSAPSLTPSTVRFTTPAQPGAAPGYLFMAPYQGRGAPGPMIVDQQGRLVWFHPLPAGVSATNFHVQQYEGHPVLTWWQGRILEVGFGQGEDEIFNDSYQHVATVRAGNGYHADLHEIRLTPEGTAWIDAFDPIDMNLSRLHGVADGVLLDSVIEEIDVKTGLVMWEWHALGHVALGESFNSVPGVAYPWDYIHINSVDPGSSGDVLLSARNMWTLYDVDLQSGQIRWRLGSQHSSFKLGPGVRFYWQHDAEFQPGGLISVFDNGSDPPKEKQSRGLLLSPDTANHSVSLVKAFVNPTKTLLASSQGDTLSLPGGDWLLGYGGLPNFTEFDPAGHVLLDGTLGRNVQDFRTYLSPWSASGEGSPAVAVQPGAGGTVSVSAYWNGATDVAQWRVLAGASASSLQEAATAPSSGFETTVAVPAAAGPYVAVQALDPSGAVLATSAPVKG